MMGADRPGVNGSVLNDTQKTYLPLSEAPDVERLPDGSPAVVAELRAERDPLTPALVGELVPSGHPDWTESEQRYAWGDR